MRPTASAVQVDPDVPDLTGEIQRLPFGTNLAYVKVFVYRTDDPRATHLRRLSKEMGERKGNTKWYDMTAKVEEVMKREKGLLPNVDAYSASTYYMMGIPLDLYTPIFAISRISGWTAHILEQYADNKLIRPRAEYVGPRNVPYVAIDER